MVRLNRTHYSLLKIYRQNFSIFQNCPIKSNPSKSCKFRAVRPHSPRITQNSHILLTYSILCFRHLPRQRTLQNSSKLRRFCAVRPHSPRITQNLHILLTYSTCVSGTCPGREPYKIPANYADSARFAHTARESCEFRTLRTKIQIYVIDFQISDHRQRTQENWSESTRFCSIRPPIMRITRTPRILQ